LRELKVLAIEKQVNQFAQSLFKL